MTTVENAPWRRGITSASASSIVSAGWVESSAAMISESEVERNWTPGVGELGVQLDRVDQVAVVRERDLALVRAVDRLGVLPGRGARRRVAHVADRHRAGERLELALVEDLRHEAEVAHGHDVAALAGGDAGGLLPAVLEREEREVGEPGDFRLGCEHAEDAALVARPVAIVELLGGGVWGSQEKRPAG